jgi:hypothetical protein
VQTPPEQQLGSQALVLESREQQRVEQWVLLGPVLESREQQRVEQWVLLGPVLEKLERQERPVHQQELPVLLALPVRLRYRQPLLVLHQRQRSHLL